MLGILQINPATVLASVIQLPFDGLFLFRLLFETHAIRSQIWQRLASPNLTVSVCVFDLVAGFGPVVVADVASAAEEWGSALDVASAVEELGSAIGVRYKDQLF